MIYGTICATAVCLPICTKFEKKKFFDEHDTIVIYTPEKLTYTIFAAYKRDDAHMMKKYDYANQARQALSTISILTRAISAKIKLDRRPHYFSGDLWGGEDDKRYIVQAVLTKEETVIQGRLTARRFLTELDRRCGSVLE